MNKTSVIAVILLCFIVVEESNASVLFKLRKMVAVEPQKKNGTVISPIQAPVSAKKPKHHLDSGISGIEKPQNSPVPDNSSVRSGNGSNVPVPANPSIPAGNESNVPVPGSPSIPAGNGSNVPVPALGSSQNKTIVAKDLNGDVIDEKCETAGFRCVQKPLVACLKHSQDGSSALFILIQNEGESALNVSVIVPASIAVAAKELEIPPHQAKKINASSKVEDNHKIVLNAGNGDCVLYTGVPISEGNFFRRIPYGNNVTPMHGVYFMSVVLIIIGGTWGWCKLVQKGQRGNSEVPYQELEMALPESVPAVNVDAENGWDQGWDDDWDEEGAVRSPGKHIGNVSGNGLNSRSSSKDGWGNDWDD